MGRAHFAFLFLFSFGCGNRRLLLAFASLAGRAAQFAFLPLTGWLRHGRWLVALLTGAGTRAGRSVWLARLGLAVLAFFLLLALGTFTLLFFILLLIARAVFALVLGLVRLALVFFLLTFFTFFFLVASAARLVLLLLPATLLLLLVLLLLLAFLFLILLTALG